MSIWGASSTASSTIATDIIPKARMGEGMGYFGLTGTLAMAVRNVPPSRRGAANATFFLGFDLGIGVGAMLWGAVAELVGYQVIYLWALLPIGIAFVIYWKARHTMGL